MKKLSMLLLSLTLALTACGIDKNTDNTKALETKVVETEVEEKVAESKETEEVNSNQYRSYDDVDRELFLWTVNNDPSKIEVDRALLAYKDYLNNKDYDKLQKKFHDEIDYNSKAGYRAFNLYTMGYNSDDMRKKLKEVGFTEENIKFGIEEIEANQARWAKEDEEKAKDLPNENKNYDEIEHELAILHLTYHLSKKETFNFINKYKNTLEVSEIEKLYKKYEKDDNYYNHNASLRCEKLMKQGNMVKEGNTQYLTIINKLRKFDFTKDNIDYAIKEYEDFATGFINELRSETASKNMVDRKKHASNLAKAYTFFNPYSKVQLRDMLKKDGFSEEEIEYAVTKSLIEWSKQAELKAEVYIESFLYSPQEIRNQLLKDGFEEVEVDYYFNN